MRPSELDAVERAAVEPRDAEAKCDAREAAGEHLCASVGGELVLLALFLGLQALLLAGTGGAALGLAAYGSGVVVLLFRPPSIGRALLVSGLALNGAAVTANGGYMPVLGVSFSPDSRWIEATEETRLLLLCDIHWGASFGDFVLFAGLGAVFYGVFRRREAQP